MNRKRFLAGGAGLAAASLLPARAVTPAAAAAPSPGALFPPERIGLQLYSVADAVSSTGFAKVLPELAEIGFKLVEFAGYEDSTGIKVKDLRKLLDDNGLKAIGSHVSPSDDESMKQILEDAAVLGIPNVGISLPLPSQGPTAAGWKALSADYNRYGELAAKQGVGFYLHNHFHEWLPTPDDPSKRGEDILLAETDPRFVFFEMDIYWAHVGQSQSALTPFDPLKDYAIPHRDRYKLFHVKDGKKNAATQDYNDALSNIVDAGQGNIDFKAFFEGLYATAPGEVERHHYIWERDNASSHPRGPMASARSSFVYIRYGLKTDKGTGAPAVKGVLAAVTAMKLSGRTLRVTVEADEPVTAGLALRRGRVRLARRKPKPLAAGRHVLTLRVPRTARGRMRVVATFKTADGAAHKIRLPLRLPR